MTIKPLFIPLIFAIAGCASVETRLPVPQQQAVDAISNQQQAQVFDQYLNHFKRLDAVSHQVLSANTGLCADTLLDPGIAVHALKSYPKALRKGAHMFLGAEDTPSVLWVRKNSPAQTLAVHVGDKILDAEDKPAFLKAKTVQANLKRGLLKIERDGDYMSLQVKPEAKCAYNVRLKLTSRVNAYADGKSITVTTGMMNFVKSDSELALVIGHELAHNTMNHVRKGIWNTVISGFAHRYTRPFEAEADYVGLYYMARAGYELGNVEQFWNRLGVYAPKSIVKAKTHPLAPERLLAIRLTRDEITAKRKAGLPLVPNLKSNNRK